MVYEQINSKILIGNIFDKFNVDYSGFISRVPNMIHAAMRELNIYTSLLNKTSPDTTVVTDYKCAIPSDCKLLTGVSYMGYRLPRTDKLNQFQAEDMPNLLHSEYSYQPDNNGYVITTFKESNEGEFKFYYKTLPIELDIITNLYFPLIPNNQDLLTALEWYILMRLLQRGHKIREYTLASNNIYLNPALAWDKWSKIAKNSVLALDADDRNEISNMIRTFLYNKNYFTSGSFNNNKTD